MENLISVIPLERCGDIGCPPTLPDNRRTGRLQVSAIPKERGLSLIGHRNGADFIYADLRHGFASCVQLSTPDVACRLLCPAGLGILRLNVLLGGSDDMPALVPDEGAAGRSSLIKGEDESRSYASSSASRRRPMTTLATAAKTASNAPTPMIRFIVRSVLLAAAASCDLYFSAQYHDKRGMVRLQVAGQRLTEAAACGESTLDHRR